MDSETRKILSGYLILLLGDSLFIVGKAPAYFIQYPFLMLQITLTLILTSLSMIFVFFGSLIMIVTSIRTGSYREPKHVMLISSCSIIIGSIWGMILLAPSIIYPFAILLIYPLSFSSLLVIVQISLGILLLYKSIRDFILTPRTNS
ncbi:MAG: hypothetical protein ACFFD8_09585 [Candidatus Thorarchaeota archaeon]